MIKYALLGIGLLVLIFDFFSRVLTTQVERDVAGVPAPLAETFTMLPLESLKFNHDLFGKIPEAPKKEDATNKNDEASQGTKLKKLTVRLVATYIQAKPFALIEVKDQKAQRVGQFQKVQVGDALDGYTVKSISSNKMTLSRESQIVTVKVFEGS